MLGDLANAKGEAALGTILGAAKESGGNLRLLAQLKTKMAPDAFENVSGILLNELGHGRGGKDFSLQSFATDWGKVSQRAKDVMFSPEHLKQIDDIVQMTQHLGKSLKETNVSHTSAPIIIFDLAKDAIMMAATMAGGAGLGAVAGPGMLAGAAAATPGVIFAKWLASPAKTASISAWSRAYRGVAGSRTPARIAAFNIATRNLSNNLGVPVESILGHVVKAQPEGNSPEPSAPGPVNH